MDNNGEKRVLQLADASNRILAFLIDIAIFIGISIVIGVLIAIPFWIFGAGVSFIGSQADNSRDVIGALTAARGGNMIYEFISGLVGIAIFVVYFVLIPVRVFDGQTIGKRILKIKVVRSNGDKVDVTDMFKRNLVAIIFSFGQLVPFIAVCFCCLWFIYPCINLVLLFTDVKKQTLNDKIADTVVISEA